MSAEIQTPDMGRFRTLRDAMVKVATRFLPSLRRQEYRDGDEIFYAHGNHVLPKDERQLVGLQVVTGSIGFERGRQRTLRIMPEEPNH